MLRDNPRIAHMMCLQTPKASVLKMFTTQTAAYTENTHAQDDYFAEHLRPGHMYKLTVNTENADPNDPGLKFFMIERRLSRAQKERKERDAVKMNFDLKMQQEDSMFKDIDSDLDSPDQVL